MNSHGGPRVNSGQEPSEFTRHKIIRVCVTESEFDIVGQLGQQWGVPRGTALYGLTLDRINECRGGVSDASTNIDKLVLAASKIVVKSQQVQKKANGHDHPSA